MAKAFRKYTGISFVDAHKIAKAYERYDVIGDLNLDCISQKQVGECPCCMYTAYIINGPRGDIDLDNFRLNPRRKRIFPNFPWDIWPD